MLNFVNNGVFYLIVCVNILEAKKESDGQFTQFSCKPIITRLSLKSACLLFNFYRYGLLYEHSGQSVNPACKS